MPLDYGVVPVYMSACSRLYALLTALAQTDPARTLRYGWSEVLAIAEADVQFGLLGMSGVSGLPDVAKLVSGACREARQAEDLVGLPLQQALADEWSKPVNMPGGNLDGPMHQQEVSAEALRYLDSVASVLRKTEDDQELPGEDELAELLIQVDDLFDSVEGATAVADDIKMALLRRIAQVRFVVANARVGGPEAVHEAVELLLGSAVVRGNTLPPWAAKKVFAVVAAAFTVFSAGPTIQASLEAWPQVVQTLSPGSSATHDTDQTPEHEPAADHPESKR